MANKTAKTSRFRIGTWNVNYGVGTRNPDRIARLNEYPADIIVLTETHHSVDLSATHHPVCSEQRPILENGCVNAGSTWVTIWSSFPLVEHLPVPDPLRMVAAIFNAPDGPVAIAGVVLPWHSDEGDLLANPKPAHWDEHQRVLRSDLPTLLKTLRRATGGSRRVIAGDFNSQQAFPYPFPRPYPPDVLLRQELADLLNTESLDCHTGWISDLNSNSSNPRMLIDHICTDLGPVEAIQTWAGEDGRQPPMSDHPGVVVTLRGHGSAD